MTDFKFNKFYKTGNILSIILVFISVIFLSFKGLNYGVDFKGGTLIELRVIDKNYNITNVRDVFNSLNLKGVSVKKFGNETDYIIKFQTEDLNNPNFINNIKSNIEKKSGIIAISLSLLAMLIYIWVRFEWQFSLGAILALFHDVILTLGIFSIFSLEINLSIVAAVLTIVGYSMNDTVVIYDRVRDNLKKYSDIKIYELSNISINETLSRTIITSVTTLLALFSIFFFGGAILKGFSLAMILGVIFGTYSSIYIACPLLVNLKVTQKTILKEDK